MSKDKYLSVRFGIDKKPFCHGIFQEMPAYDFCGRIVMRRPYISLFQCICIIIIVLISETDWDELFSVDRAMNGCQFPVIAIFQFVFGTDVVFETGSYLGQFFPERKLAPHFKIES